MEALPRRDDANVEGPDCTLFNQRLSFSRNLVTSSTLLKLISFIDDSCFNMIRASRGR
jgi:hypothetical protein